MLTQDLLDPQICDFYCQSLRLLREAKIPFLVGGTFAFEYYTGIARETKDLDLFVRQRDCLAVLKVFRRAGYDTKLPFPHWLGKASRGGNFVDFIFNSANGYGEVDDIWFERAIASSVLDVPVLLCPAEEMFCSKAFIMARDRYDGADIAHLLLRYGDRLDWPRLIERFGPHWRVLLSHLILFGFIYPSQRSGIPDWVMPTLLQRLQAEMNTTPPSEKLCKGTMLAPLQYLVDVEKWGYQDARLHPWGNITEDAIARWTVGLEAEK